MTIIRQPSASRGVRRHGGMPWPKARLLAAQPAAEPAKRVALSDALGCILAGDLIALGDLPAADNSAMDGWAVAGPPPWRVMADLPAGQLYPRHLRTGECVRIATGATVPVGTDAVLPVEDSVHAAVGVRPASAAWSAHSPARTHIRSAGEEARRGDLLLPAGTSVTPPVLGLAAAAGNDTLLVVPAATVEVLVLGDELLDTGIAAAGRTRDALGPQLPGWLSGFGVRPDSMRRLPDDLATLRAAIADSSARVLLTTGGTSVGPRDHVRGAISQLDGHLLVDGVDVKPGHPMLLAALPGDRWLVGLPGNPLAACVTLLTLVEPLLAALHGKTLRLPSTVQLASAEAPRCGDGHRVLPVRITPGGTASVLPSCGSAMLRGLAVATGLAVIAPTGARAGDDVTYLSLPWPT